MDEQEQRLTKIYTAWKKIDFAGQFMSTFLFNLSQNYNLDEREREKAKQLYQEWDAAQKEMAEAWK